MTKQQEVAFNLNILIQLAVIEICEESLSRGKELITRFDSEG